MDGKKKSRRKGKLEDDNENIEVLLKEGESPVSRGKAKKKTNCINEKDDSTGCNSNEIATKKETDSLERILRKKVPWDGYSPLHCVVGGTRPGVLTRLIEMGYVRNKGKWTPDEIEQLDQNMKEFFKDHGITDLKSFICNQTREQRNFRRKTQFLQKVCKGLSRTGYDVYMRLWTQFSTFVKKGPYSKEERIELKRLHMIHGHNWKQIGLCLNRNYFNLSDTYHNILSKNWKKGKWTLEEKKSLITSVINHFERNEPVSWRAVSKDVKTRSSKNCRNYWCNSYSQIKDWEAYNKWLLNSEKKEDTIEEISFSNNDTLNLVNLISDANIDDEYLIDWNDLVKHFDQVTSPAWLKWKFQAVCKEVPHSFRLEFTDLVEELHTIYEKKILEVKDDKIPNSTDTRLVTLKQH